MSRFRYPVDTDQFQNIREQGLLYVDKTDMMYDLANKYRYVFLARSRRFGKSLLCNTFKAYFKGQKELFEACPEQGRRACPESESMVSSSNQRGLKVDDTVENALAQIDDKGYAIPYEADASTGSAQVQRTVTKCGVSISSEHRNITHWRIVSQDGNIIDEQMFR